MTHVPTETGQLSSTPTELPVGSSQERNGGGLSLAEKLGGVAMIAGVGLIYAEHAAVYSEAQEQLVTADPSPEAIVLGAVLAVGGAIAAAIGHRRRNARNNALPTSEAGDQ